MMTALIMMLTIPPKLPLMIEIAFNTMLMADRTTVIVHAHRHHEGNDSKCKEYSADCDAAGSKERLRKHGKAASR